MFLTLSHTQLEVYKSTYALTLESYKLIKKLPDEERFNLISQIRRAALSVHLNLSEGCSRQSKVERKRYYEIARGSVIEIDSALDIIVGLNYLRKDEMLYLGEIIVTCFKELCGMIDNP